MNLKQAAWFSAIPWATMAISGYIAGATSDSLIKAGYPVTYVRKLMQVCFLASSIIKKCTSNYQIYIYIYIIFLFCQGHWKFEALVSLYKILEVLLVEGVYHLLFLFRIKISLIFNNKYRYLLDANGKKKKN